MEETKEIAEMFGLDPNELEINFDQLDVEWGRQDNLLNKYLKASAYAEKLATKAEEKVKLTRSKLILDISSDPEGCLGKGQKATGPTIEAYYRCHKDHITAKDELIEACHIRDLIVGQKSRAYNRKSILEEATKLSLAGWFSAPLVPRPLQELVQKIEEQKMKATDRMIRTAVVEKRQERRARRNREMNE